MNDTAVIVPAPRVEKSGRQLTPIADQTEAGALMSFIARAATDPTIDMDKLQRLLDMQERMAAKRAEVAYSNAMADFKAASISIAKNKHVSFRTDKGVTEYYHATLDEVCRSINPELGANGLSYRWLTEQGEQGRIRVTCIVSHSGGHSERTALSSSPDDSGRKNNIQAIGSAVSYLQRYTLLAALGLATGGTDDDGTSTDAVEAERISEKQIADIEALLSEVGGDKKRFLAYQKLDSLADILAKNYPAVIKEIEAKRNQGSRR